MALDPVLMQLLAQIPAVPPGPIDWAQLRRSSAALAQALIGPQGLPEVASAEDVLVPGPAGVVPVRIYRPTGPTTTTVHFIHGGGWALGDVNAVDHTARRLCRDLPAVVVSSTYRLAPEHPYPAALDDTLAVAKWVLATAESLGGDPSRVVISGDSAGGNLAAAACVALHDDSRSTSKAQARRHAAHLLFNPAVDLRPPADRYASRRADADPTLKMASVEQCYEAYLQGSSADDPGISPVAAGDLSGLPPALTVVLSVDPLRDEAVEYAARLKAAGVRSELIEFDNLVHGFINLAGVVPAAAAATEIILGKLRELLSPISTGQELSFQQAHRPSCSSGNT